MQKLISKRFFQVNKIALSANDDKRIQSIDLVETYAYGTNEQAIH